MIVNNLPDVVGSAVTKSARPAGSGASFANTLEKKIVSATNNTADVDPQASVPEVDVDTPASVLIAGNDMGFNTVLAEDGEHKHDGEKASDETPFIDPQIQQLQQLVAQTPPVTADGGAIDVQASQTTAVAETAIASVPASGPLAQPFMLESRKDGVAQTTVAGLSEGNAETKVENKEDLFSSLLDKKSTGEKPAGLVKPDAGAATQPLTQEAEAPQFHAAMVDNLKAVAQPAAAATSVTSGTLTETLGTPAWQQSLGQQVTMFTRNGIHNAQLHLHPEELGDIQINLRLNNDRAQLHFVTENYQVRAAIEAAMPHLRSSLAESGIQLGQSSVGADASQSGGFFSHSEQDNPSRAGEHQGDVVSNSEDTPEAQIRVVHPLSGINTFA